MTAVRRLITLMTLSLAATALLAQDATTTPRTTDAVTAETDRDATDPRAMRLSLDEALSTSLQQNLGIQLQSYDFRIASENVRGQYGLFDWLANGSLATRSDERPTTNPFEPNASRSTSLDLGVSQIIPTGGQYTIGWDNSRSTVAGGGTFVNPQLRSGIDFAFNQPLLRDFGVDITRRGITIARNNLGITQGAFETAVMDTVSAVEQAYLDLIYARRAVDVVKESLFLARDQARITQIRIDVGASAPLDILQPRVTIATSEELLIGAAADVRRAEDRLRALMNLPETEWDRPIIPTDEVSYTPMEINLQSAVQQAIANRPEMTQQEFQTENLRIQALYARNQTLPTVDFVLNYGLAGLAGRSPELDDEGNPTGDVRSEPYFDTFNQIAGLDFPTWNVGFNFGVPILNVGARADARAAELDLEQSQLTRAQTRQNIALEVRNAARAVNEFAQAIAATRAARDAAEQNVEAERRRYENGMTTNFQVLEVQQQLSDARVRELNAIVGYNKAVALFHRNVGDILEVHDITLQEPERTPEPRIFGFGLDRYNWLNYGRYARTESQPNDDGND